MKTFSQVSFFYALPWLPYLHSFSSAQRPASLRLCLAALPPFLPCLHSCLDSIPDLPPAYHAPLPRSTVLHSAPLRASAALRFLSCLASLLLCFLPFPASRLAALLSLPAPLPHALPSLLALLCCSSLPFCSSTQAQNLLSEIHRASGCALQGLLRPIDSRGEANLVSPRDFQKINPLIFCVLIKFNSRGEFYEGGKSANQRCKLQRGARTAFPALDSSP